MSSSQLDKRHQRRTGWTRAEWKSFMQRGYPSDIIDPDGPTDADRVKAAREAILEAIRNLRARRVRGKVACPGVAGTRAAIRSLKFALAHLRKQRRH